MYIMLFCLPGGSVWYSVDVKIMILLMVPKIHIFSQSTAVPYLYRESTAYSKRNNVSSQTNYIFIYHKQQFFI